MTQLYFTMKCPIVCRLLLNIAFVLALPENIKRDFSVGQEVTTSSGLLVGKPASQRTAVSEYLGVPFAQPPVGNLRFAAPQPYRGSGVINATAYVSTSSKFHHILLNAKHSTTVSVRDPISRSSRRYPILTSLVTVLQIHKAALRFHPGLQVPLLYVYLLLLPKLVTNSAKIV